MEFLKKHEVIVIDDEYKEAMPVIQALATKGVPTIYWNGKVDTKPEKPMEGIRFVFLDMRFSAVSDSHTITTYLFTLLKTAISIKNGPYILFIWTKHDSEYLEDFKKEFLDVEGVPVPYLIINMEKNNFIKLDHEKNEVYNEIVATLESEQEIKDEILEVLKNNNINDTIETINIIGNGIDRLINSLDEKLNEVNSLAVLLLWENMVNISAKNLVNTIANFSEANKNWDNNIKTVIQNLALANAGQSLKECGKGYVINALLAFNQMLPDELWNQLVEEDIKEEMFNFISNPSIVKTVSDNTYSISRTPRKYVIKKNNADYDSFRNINDLKEHDDNAICVDLYNTYSNFLGQSNFKMLCERTVFNEIKKPGSIYKIEDNQLLKELTSSIFKANDLEKITKTQLIKLDISSSCDYAQDKLKRIRILPGIMVEKENFSYIDNTEDIYCTPDLEVDGNQVKIAFNFQYITNEAKEDLSKENKLFSFRELLLTEIKHKLSSYISRVGIINL